MRVYCGYTSKKSSVTVSKIKGFFKIPPMVCKMYSKNDPISNSIKKCEMLLRRYKAFEASEDEYAQRMVYKIHSAFELIKRDRYYFTVPGYYIHGMTREELADYFGCTVTTISRNKTRLMKDVTAFLFSEDVIKEILKE